MKSIYFAYYNIPLNHQNILKIGSGASEVQICLLAKSLSDRGFDVTCFYGGQNEKVDNIYYRNYNELENNENIDQNTPLIFWRHFNKLPKIFSFYNPQKIILWSHDYRGIGLTDDIVNIINSNDTKIVTVSNFHKYSIKKVNQNNIIVIYNALYSQTCFYKENLEIDKNRIVFASAWIKGIDTILNLFDKLYIKYPNFYLNILSPNHGKIDIENRIKNKPYFKLSGTITDKQELSQILQTSLCLISTEFPETFGCIFAEAYYLKTPVIATHIPNGLYEYIDINHRCNLKNYDEFEHLLISFYEKRPKVELDEKFLDTNIVNKWHSLLESI